MTSAIRNLHERIAHEQRLTAAHQNPLRRKLASGEAILDHRLESPLGRLAFQRLITQDEYDAGRRWQDTYLMYLRCIGAPYPFANAISLDEPPVVGPMEMPSDWVCEQFTRKFKQGLEILRARGKGVFHIVNCVAVYEEESSSEWLIPLRDGLRALCGI